MLELLAACPIQGSFQNMISNDLPMLPGKEKFSSADFAAALALLRKKFWETRTCKPVEGSEVDLACFSGWDARP
ncbi:MAG: hypothetical protein LBC79_06445, partial [Deltaproteobacteria bacterium]|nr:hypothetical protein [Deltaproteobacteria bacterium]